jgi:hypothetical protein
MINLTRITGIMSRSGRGTKSLAATLVNFDGFKSG